MNAKNHEREAEIVAQAGGYGAVTIATNMAGRGTDILLGGNAEYLAKKRLREEGVDREIIELATSYAELDEETEKIRTRYRELYSEYKKRTEEEKQKVIEAGGLCIIGTERHESRRIDNQLRGRSGRQGDTGTSIFFLSLEDDLMLRFGGERMQRIYSTMKIPEDECIESKLLSRLIEYAQRQIEGRNFGIRKNVLQYDDVMNQQRKLMYAERMKVLRGEPVHEQILKYIPDYVESVVREAVSVGDAPQKWSEEDLNAALEQKLLPEGTNYVTREKLEKWDYEEALKRIIAKTEKCYEEKIARMQEMGVDFHDFERRVLLRNVDVNWIDHIDEMDRLRKGIGLRAYANTDPVISYKQEGSAMFQEMIERIQTNTVAMLLKVRLEVRQRPVQRIMPSNMPARPAQAPAQAEGENRPEKAPNAVENGSESAPKQTGEEGLKESPREERDLPASAASMPAVPAAVNVDALKTSGSEKFNPASMPKKKKIGPNDLCPCGSGLKYKKCHGKP